jgi:hypothetical protein
MAFTFTMLSPDLINGTGNFAAFDSASRHLAPRQAHS